MSVFKIGITTDNAAFEDDGPVEIARILRKLADELDGECVSITWMGPAGRLQDVNGNTVGMWEWDRDA